MYCVFPLQRGAEEWMRSYGRVLMSWSIFNPNGPTLNCIGFRDTGSRGEMEVFFRWMHFLGGEDYCLGYVNIREPQSGSDFLEILRNAFSLQAGNKLRRFPLVTCLPSFALVSAEDPWASALRSSLNNSRAIQEEDWGRQQFLLHKFGSALFDRAGEEYREACEELLADKDNLTDDRREFLKLYQLWLGDIKTFRDWEPGQFESRGLEDGDLDVWWSTVSDGSFIGVAASQFAQAWVGAIHKAPQQAVTQIDEVSIFLEHYSHPLWPAEMTTQSLRKRMGLDEDQFKAPIQS